MKRINGVSICDNVKETVASMSDYSYRLKVEGMEKDELCVEFNSVYGPDIFNEFETYWNNRGRWFIEDKLVDTYEVNQEVENEHIR